MVIRIAPDSDFESEDDTTQRSAGTGDGDHESSRTTTAIEVSPVPSPKVAAAARSVRKVIRQRDLGQPLVGTYDYDSDIYTEESSMGSFIVNSDDDEKAPQSESENTGGSLLILY